MSPTKTESPFVSDRVQPREAAAGKHNDVPFVLSPKEVFSVDHELVRAFPHLFRDADAGHASRPDVEQATAAPGEKRGEDKGSKRGKAD